MPLITITFDWPVFVRTLRSEAYLDVTQRELAQRVGVSVSSVVKWEAGAVTPCPRHRSTLRRLAARAGYRQRQWPAVSRRVEGDGTIYYDRSINVFDLHRAAATLRGRRFPW